MSTSLAAVPGSSPLRCDATGVAPLDMGIFCHSSLQILPKTNKVANKVWNTQIPPLLLQLRVPLSLWGLYSRANLKIHACVNDYWGKWDYYWDCGDIVCTNTSVQKFSRWPPNPHFFLLRGVRQRFLGADTISSPVGQVHIVKLTLVLMTWSLQLPLHMGGMVQMCRCKHAGNQGRTTLISVQRKPLSTHTPSLFATPAAEPTFTQDKYLEKWQRTQKHGRELQLWEPSAFNAN